MDLAPTGSDPREVLRALRAAVLGAGPAAALGEGWFPYTVPAGTAVVISTSGSTGTPKRVALSRSALTSSALATAERIGSGAWLLALPANYIAGVQVLVRSLVGDREPAILSGAFSPQAFAAAAGGMASSVGGVAVPTYTSLVPAQLQRLLDAEDAGLDTGLATFEAVLVGGQSLPTPLRERAASAGVRLVRTYGSSETAGGCVYDGVPLDGVDVRIVEGEILIAGPTLADGYLGQPAGTHPFETDDTGRRWFHTGDLGALSDGVLTVTGRVDNVIVSGGVNVSLDRVEAAVLALAGHNDLVVVGVPDERWGEVPVLVTGPAVALPPLPEIRRSIGAELGPPARPDRVVTLEVLPRLASGKPDRVAIRAAVIAEDARDD